eukprot:TRINITY_DN828_c0_g1_i1.p1 TRINITY_DN828_c0_g1~~TRINITY_DN828_c0_g1_i1.p1  ORF type:complete len:234 (+),score=35.84 TRINITY_DN828_c0_g1_i1:24-725(+)
MPYITQSGLNNLKYYKYVGTDKSLIANYIMQPFWRKLVYVLPEWLAPNLVTLLGFAAIITMFFTTTTQVREDGTLPSFVFLLNAACIFFYQTMDALDGKQARRTGTSSPLGELFDHGCDAVTTVLLAVVNNLVMRVEYGWLFYFTIFIVMVAFYTAQWEYYFTGNLALGYINVTEAQFTAIAMNLFPYFAGHDLFIDTVPGIDFPVKVLLLGFFYEWSVLEYYSKPYVHFPIY